jgi:hypothetical protein
MLGQLVLANAAIAADPLPLDDEFLDYLSQFESKSDDWTLFADEERAPAKLPTRHDVPASADAKHVMPASPAAKDVEP